MSGHLVFHQEDLVASDAPVRFDIGSYPPPPPPDDRPRKVATVRMLWRRDGTLAAAVGREYLEEDEPHLIPQSEWEELQRSPHEPDASSKRGRSKT